MPVIGMGLIYIPLMNIDSIVLCMYMHAGVYVDFFIWAMYLLIDLFVLPRTNTDQPNATVVRLAWNT